MKSDGLPSSHANSRLKPGWVVGCVMMTIDILRLILSYICPTGSLIEL
jgi:hypothetical protein